MYLSLAQKTLVLEVRSYEINSKKGKFICVMETVFKPTPKEKCTLKAIFPEKNEAFLSSLLSLSCPDLNNCEHSLTLSKTNTKIQFLHIYRINAARRDEVLGKTTGDVQCQKFAMHKINLNICTSTSFFISEAL